MKTSIDISENLLKRANELARAQDVTLQDLVEEGLRKVIQERSKQRPGNLGPVTFKGTGLSLEYSDANWDQIRDASYPEPPAQ